MRVHDSQAYRKLDVARARTSRILELREILLSIQTVVSLVNAAVVCAILESISGLEPSSLITEPSLKDHQRLVLTVICNYSALCVIPVGVSKTPPQGPVC